MKKLLLFFFFVCVWNTNIFSQRLDSLAKIAEIETIIHHQKSINELKKFLKYSSKQKIIYTQKISEYTSKLNADKNKLYVFIGINTDKYVIGVMNDFNKDKNYFIFDVKNKILLKIELEPMIIYGRNKTGEEIFIYRGDKKNVIHSFSYCYHTKKLKIIYKKEYIIGKVSDLTSEYIERNFSLEKKTFDNYFMPIQEARKRKKRVDNPKLINFN